jgi:hypothetical protein
MMEPEIIRMYNGGPLRLFSQDRFLGGVPYRDSIRTGFAGNYICSTCRRHTPWVIATSGEWVCRSCVLSMQRQG